MAHGLPSSRLQAPASRGLACFVGLSLGALGACQAGKTPLAKAPQAMGSRAHAAWAEDQSGAPIVVAPLQPGETGFAIRCSKIITFDAQQRILAPGTLIVRNGKIDAVAAECVVPPGFEQLEADGGWLCPGFIDLHSHVQSSGFQDTNDMVVPINTDLRASVAVRTGNPNLQRALAAGITTLFGIPGSGTSISGFGVLYKTKGARTPYDECVLRDPGGMKVAQAYNPERGSGDLGSTRAGLSWLLEDINEKARAALAQGRKDPSLANLMLVHAKQLPVLIHTAGSDGVGNTVRMWKERYDTRAVLTHGSFDGWKVAAYAARTGMPINNGPRIIDYQSAREGRFVGLAAEYLAAGAQVSLNTDSPVIPQEELGLQGTMASRYGADPYSMLAGLTIVPARSFGIDDRVGSLESGKDADVVMFSGNPQDPRSRVEWVMIDGKIEYDRLKQGQRF